MLGIIRTIASSNVLPDAEEIERVALPPDAYTHQVFGDARLYLAAAYALLLQVSHPTVGSGVRDHSSFQEDPWDRLLRTMDYLYMIALPGEQGAAVGRRIRELHKQIKGTNPDGSRYHALEPEAYAWVHATLIEGAIRSYRAFVGRLDDADAERVYAEYAPMGRLLGIRPGDLPDSWAEFGDYFETTCDERLERTQSVDDVLRAISRPAAPPVPFLRPLWPLLRIPPRRLLSVATAGLMAPGLRQRLGIRKTRPMALEFRALSLSSRAATPLIPASLLDISERHLRWRQEAIATGPLGPGADEAAPGPLAEAA